MRLYKFGNTAFLEHDNQFFSSLITNWDMLINRKNLYDYLMKQTSIWGTIDALPEIGMEAPIGSQEIWAAGVTYQRSKVARMEESKNAGGGSFYDRVYDADRPELFFKATAARTVAPGKQVAIRKDSTWNVPEPEITLLISSEGTIEGYTIGNDMSSRSIEGENPLYLPQAKSYDGSAAIGPCIYITKQPIPLDTQIQLTILREGQTAFQESIPISQMKRSFEDLVSWLYRECSFPYGSFLMTGTGIIPHDDFTLAVGDEIHITIAPIGTLVNIVGQN